jgi:hypothetical protein
MTAHIAQLQETHRAKLDAMRAGFERDLKHMRDVGLDAVETMRVKATEIAQNEVREGLAASDKRIAELVDEVGRLRGRELLAQGPVAIEPVTTKEPCCERHPNCNCDLSDGAFG